MAAFRKGASFAECGALLAFGLLGGCATPDLQPFAEQTARLATAVSGEQREIALKLEEVIQLYGEACRQRDERKKQVARLPVRASDARDSERSQAGGRRAQGAA
jgi:hypothetical protein